MNTGRGRPGIGPEAESRKRAGRPPGNRETDVAGRGICVPTDEDKQMKEKSSFWKYLRWGLGLVLFVFGLWGFIFSYTQPVIKATVTSVGPATAQKHRPSHGNTYTTYHRTLEVRFEQDGKTVDAKVDVSYRNSWAPPRVNMELDVSRNPFGSVVAVPDLTLRKIGLYMAIGGGILLAAAWLTGRAKARKEQEDVRTGGAAPVEKAEEAEQIPETLHRLERGGFWWIGTVDEDYFRQNAGMVIKIMGIIAAGILLIGIIPALTEGTTELLWILLLTDAFLMGIVFLVYRAVIRSGYSRKQYHEIREDGLCIGQGKSRNYYPWEKVLDVQDQGTYLEISGKVLKSRVYAPAEIMPFVREYVMNHVSRRSL